MLLTLYLSLAVIYISPGFSESDDIYRSKTSDDYVPCDRGWYFFRDKCYRVASRSDPAPWTRALELCKGFGADLVSIQSKEEQDFIVAYLQLAVKWWSWIGLNDRDKEGDFRWSDGSVFNYSNWHTNEPSGVDSQTGKEKEDCVHIIFEPTVDAVGKWNDRSCDTGEYALCEKSANPKKRSPNLMYCSPAEGGGWKYESSCYHIVTEMKSWEDAERYCKNYFNGHLLTIRDTLEDLFLELALPDIKNEIWIGINIQEKLQQKWTSGWYVSYEKFDEFEFERYVEGTCVARKNRKEWITIPCSRQLPFICETSKAIPPVLKPPPVGSYCPTESEGWRDLGGDYCYYIQTAKYLDFYEANFECQRRGGDLVSIHSKEEADILQPFVRYTGYSIYIGLIRLKDNEDTFGWTDKSKLDYTNWGHAEPNSMDEKCVEALTLLTLTMETMEWRDTTCKNKLSGYICSVKKISPRSSLFHDLDNCANFCVVPHSYLYGLLSQCPDAKEISSKKR